MVTNSAYLHTSSLQGKSRVFSRNSAKYIQNSWIIVIGMSSNFEALIVFNFLITEATLSALTFQKVKILLNSFICTLPGCSSNCVFVLSILSLFRSRSSRPEVFGKKGALRNFAKFTGKHLCQSLFFNKVAGLRPATLLKKRLWHSVFL